MAGRQWKCMIEKRAKALRGVAGGYLVTYALVLRCIKESASKIALTERSGAGSWWRLEPERKETGVGLELCRTMKNHRRPSIAKAHGNAEGGEHDIEFSTGQTFRANGTAVFRVAGSESLLGFLPRAAHASIIREPVYLRSCRRNVSRPARLWRKIQIPG